MSGAEALLGIPGVGDESRAIDDEWAPLDSVNYTAHSEVVAPGIRRDWG